MNSRGKQLGSSRGISTRFISIQLTLVLTCAFAAHLGAAQAPSPVPTASVSIDAALLAKANAGDPAAQVAVGEQYAKAGATEHYRTVAAQDYQQAASWYLKSANQKSVDGELHLAALYRDGGNGFDRDMQQAAAWYLKAANQGDVPAQGTLGVLYSMGQGVARDDSEAYFWLDIAASSNGPNQEKYASTRQMIGERITSEQLADVQDRVAAWKAVHPQSKSSK